MTTTEARPAREAWRFETMPGWAESIKCSLRATIDFELATVELWDDEGRQMLQLAPSSARTLGAALAEAADVAEAAHR